MGKKYKDEEWLQEKYVDDELTVKEMAARQEVTSSTIYYWLGKFDIELIDRSADKVKTHCDNCGKEIYKFEREIREHTFCDSKCQGEWTKDNNRVEVKCEWCGKEFRKRKCKISKHNFCCHEHYGKWLEGRNTGEDHPKYTSKIVYCKYCGDPIKRPKWHRERTEKGNYCDHECYSKSLEDGKVLTSCINCGDRLLLTRNRYLRNRNNFCSLECSQEWHRGENAAAWKGGRMPDYRGPNWNQKREEILKRDNYTCQKCGAESTETRLDIHHIIPFRDFEKENIDKEADLTERFDWVEANEEDNLVTLCVSCHKKVEEQDEVSI